MSLFKYISILCVAFIGVSSYAQNYTGKAYTYYQSKNLDSAKVYIDSAVFNSEESKYSKTWQLRGVIYRNLERTSGIKNREIAIQSFIKSRDVDLEGEYSEAIAKYLYNINVRYYNDAVQQIQDTELEEAEKSYETYKSNYKTILKINKDFTKQDVQFYSVLGGAWFKKNSSVSLSEKEAVYNNAIRAFEKTLVIDSLNYDANYGIGISYYNQGVDLVSNQNPFETDIEALDKIQNLSIAKFKAGEPYLLRAHKVNPNEKQVIEGLAGIYYSLNYDDLYNKFKDLLDKEKEGE